MLLLDLGFIPILIKGLPFQIFSNPKLVPRSHQINDLYLRNFLEFKVIILSTSTILEDLLILVNIPPQVHVWNPSRQALVRCLFILELSLNVFYVKSLFKVPILLEHSNLLAEP